MANIYVRSTTGSDSNSGSGWATAKATLEGARLIAAAGDTIFVSQAHTQAFGTGSYDFVSPGTLSNPVRVIGVDDSAEPPTALHSTKPSFTATTGNITFTGHVERVNLSVEVGSGASTNALTPATFLTAQGVGAMRGSNCVFRHLSTAGRSISYGGSSTGFGSLFVEENTEFHLGGNAGGGQSIALSKGRLELYGCSTSATMNTPAGLFALGSQQYGSVELFADGFDCSSMASTLKLLKLSLNINAVAIFRNSKFPSGWDESLFQAGTVSPGSTAELHNCSAGSTIIRYLKWDCSGVIRSNETNVRTGGANDGTAYSLRFVTNANANNVNSLFGKELPAVYISTTGSPVTATVEILIDSADACTNDDYWIEGSYLPNSGDTVSEPISSRKAPLATAATLPSSSETWVETGLTNPQKRKMQVTFTPGRAGFLHLRPVAAKKSTTAYVDYKITVA
jgi:hypothetical protein